MLLGVLVSLYSVAGSFSALAGVVALIAVALLWPALWHSSLRFRLANTGWRGLRFVFEGHRAGAYRAMLPIFGIALVFVVISLWLPGLQPEAPATTSNPPAAAREEPSGALLFALGAIWLLALLGAPWVLWLMRRYQHTSYAFAGERTRFLVTLQSWYLLFLLGAGVALLSALGLMVVSAMLASLTRVFGMVAVLAGLLLGFIAFQALLLPWFVVRMQNLVWSGTRSARLAFESTLSFQRFAGLCVKNWLLILVTLGLYFPFAAVAAARMRLEAVSVLSDVDPALLVATGRPDQESAAGDAAGDLLGIDIGL